jgi:hypothetical protein
MLMYQRVWVTAVLVITAGINAMPAPGNTGLKSDILNSSKYIIIIAFVRISHDFLHIAISFLNA